ncbi:MAG: oligosaccharide flippase family protein [Bacteroidetes bacterium]|nr:oligosaccharide flippase family protein [Bacteroidota bacterium]
MTGTEHGSRHIEAYGGTLLSRVIAAGTTLALHLLIARTLGPSEYAAVALYVTFVAVFQMLLSFGNEALLVREGGMVSKRARSVAVLAPLLALLLSLLLAITAYPLQSLFAIPGLAMLLVWGLPVLPLQISQVVYRVELLHRQEYQKIARSDVYGNLVAWFPAVALFLVTHDVIVFVVYLALMHAVRLLLYRRHVGRPAPAYRRQDVRLSHYLHSWRIISIETTTFLTTTFDDIMVALNLGATMLGLYHLAYRVITITQEFFAGVMRFLSYPQYAQAAADRRMMYRLFCRDTRFMLAVLLPFLTVLLMTAEDFIPLVMGEDWSSVIGIFRLLTIEAMRQSLLALGGQALLSIGEERALLRYSIISAIVLLPLFILLSLTDLETFVWGFVAANTLLNILFFHYIRSSFARPVRPLLHAWIPGIAASLFLGITLAALHAIAAPASSAMLVVSAVALAGVWWLTGAIHPDIRRWFVRAFFTGWRKSRAAVTEREIRIFTDGPFDETNIHLRDLYRSITAKQDGIRVEPLDLRRRLLASFRSPFALRRPHAASSILHIHYPQFIYEGVGIGSAITRSMCRLATLLLLRAFGHRVVITLHDNGGHDYPHRRWERFVLTLIIHSADAVTTLSREGGRVLFEEYGYSPDVWVAPHCVYRVEPFDTERRRNWRTENGCTDADIVILLYGTVKPYKGFDSFVKAACEAADVPLTLVCAGAGMAAVSEGRTRAGRTRAGLRIITLDRYIGEEETATLMDAADFGALPYRRILHSGTAMLFVSHGCPVIAPKMGVFLDHEREYRIGLYYDPRTPADLQRVLRESVTRPRQEFADAMSHFRLYHCLENERDAMLDVYRDVAGLG